LYIITYSIFLCTNQAALVPLPVPCSSHLLLLSLSQLVAELGIDAVRGLVVKFSRGEDYHVLFDVSPTEELLSVHMNTSTVVLAIFCFNFRREHLR